MPDTLSREEHQHKRRSPCCRDEAVRWLRESLNGSLGLGGLFLDEYNKGYAAGKKDGDIDTAAHIDALTAAVRALNQDLDSADHDSIEDGPAFAAGGRWVIEKVVNLLERP